MEQHLLHPLDRAFVRSIHRGSVPLSWYLSANWGDALSPIITSWLSGKPVVHIEGLHHDRFLVIGSILGCANERAEVWGAGFIREGETAHGRPRAVHAVRGPLSRAALISQGIECPEIYGDPALLLPRMWNPGVVKTHAVGIIPHYVDKAHPWLDQYRADPRVIVIDIEQGITGFVNQVKSCEVILSSSLHGLICADAYGIPNAWVRLSDAVIGGDFKFRDYRLSIGADEPKALCLTSGVSLAGAVACAESRTVDLNLDALIDVCPFISQKMRQQLLPHRSASDEHRSASLR
ncbi:MAG: polysaccharide pyruvyl transferase family protein [Holophagaceae bacterium]